MKSKPEFPDYKKLSVADLVPYARNSRTHSPQQVDKIAASIREFGFLNPIIVDGRNGIVAGHGRVMAAQKLGLSELPVIDASHLSEAQKRAYVIADNRLALDAGWDNEMLRIEIGDLLDLDFDVSLTGFDSAEIAAFSFDDDSETDMPALKDGDREPFQQMTFTVHDEQAEEIKTAIEKARKMGPFVATGNDNGNGNALARICEVFNGVS